MAADNRYLGLKRGASDNPGNVVTGTATAGTAVDVEVRLQLNDGSNATNLTRLDAIKLLEIIGQYIEQGGYPGALGTNLPAN